MEYQYNRSHSKKDEPLPSVMNNQGHGTATITLNGVVSDSKEGEKYNDPFEMMPSTGSLMKQLSSTFVAGTANHEG